MSLVTCAFCGEKTVDKKSSNYIRYKDKNFHKECGLKQQEKDNFFKYVCEIFKLKSPGPKIYSQANSFVQYKHYTYKGMQYTLEYIYKVIQKKDNQPFDAKSIGLIPYYYEEAKKYFTKIEIKKENNQKILNNITSNQQIINVPFRDKEKELFIYDIENL